MILLAIIALLAVFTGAEIMYRLSYFVALGVAGSYGWVRISLSRLDMQVQRQSSLAQVGGVLTGSIYIRNNCPVSTGWLEILQMSDMPGYVFGEVTRLPARGWAEWRTEGYCYSRGVYEIGPLVATGSDPLGLFRMQAVRGSPVTVVVYPPVVELPRFDLPITDLSGEERTRRHLHIRSSQASTVREYDRTDSLNRIHWPSTARCGQLMSKEFDTPVGSDIWIILDLEARVHESTNMEKSDEYAVSAAASLASMALREGRSLGLIAYGDQEYLLPPGSGARQMSRVLEMLAWSKTDGDAPLAEVLHHNTMRLDRFASLLIVTSSTETEWVSVLRNLLGRGLSSVVVLIDPLSFGGQQSSSEVVVRLLGAGIRTYMVERRDDLRSALSRPITPDNLTLSGQGVMSELTLA